MSSKVNQRNGVSKKILYVVSSFVVAVSSISGLANADGYEPAQRRVVIKQLPVIQQQQQIVVNTPRYVVRRQYQVRPHYVQPRDIIITRPTRHVVIRNNTNYLRQRVYQHPTGPRNTINLGYNPGTLPSVVLSPNRFAWIANSSPYGYGYNNHHVGNNGGAYYGTNYVNSNSNSYPHRPYNTPHAVGSSMRYKAAVPRYVVETDPNIRNTYRDVRRDVRRNTYRDVRRNVNRNVRRDTYRDVRRNVNRNVRRDTYRNVRRDTYRDVRRNLYTNY